MSKRITEKQDRVYQFVCDFIEEKGYPPTVREIGNLGGLGAPATIKFHLDKLVAAEYISVERGKTRSITVLDRRDRENFVPLLGNVAAGSPILAEELVEDYVPYPTQGRPDEFFALRVRGDSMVNAGILSEDFIVVQKKETCHQGEIVVAIFEDEATVKTLRLKNGKTWLMPENDDYEPIDGDFAHIIGKVVSVVRHYN